MGMAMVAVGVSVVFWPILWGSSTLNWTDPLPKYGGILQALGMLPMAVGLVGFGIERAKDGMCRTSSPQAQSSCWSLKDRRIEEVPDGNRRRARRA
ncbi:MAG: hypothetical protein ACRDXD_07795 [Acidimicrobiia bacterium]